MKEYNYLQAIYMSFFSRKLYRDVHLNWGAGTVLYLFILLAICWALMLFKYQPNITRTFTKFVTVVSPQFPVLNIKEGRVSTPEKKPYVIKDPERQEIIGIIDTSGQYNNLDEAPANTKLLLTETKLYYLSDHTVKITPLPTTLNMDVKPETIKQKVIAFVGWSWVLLYPLFLFISFIYRIIQALIYAVIGKIFAALSNNPISYSSVLKLSMVAITPAIILATIFDWFYVEFHFQLLLYFILTMGYLIFAIDSNKTN